MKSSRHALPKITIPIQFYLQLVLGSKPRGIALYRLQKSTHEVDVGRQDLGLQCRHLLPNFLLRPNPDSHASIQPLRQSIVRVFRLDIHYNLKQGLGLSGVS